MNDRYIHRASQLDGLAFGEEDGLLPVVVQDAVGGDILMLAYADRAALERTLETRRLHHSSGSHSDPEPAGEPSGDAGRLHSLYAGCDGSAILALVRPEGPTCHDGGKSCFGVEGTVPTSVLDELWKVLESRARDRPEGSRTAQLLADPGLRMRGLAERAAGLAGALAQGDNDAVLKESASLTHHMLVELLCVGATLEDLMRVLREARRP